MNRPPIFSNVPSLATIRFRLSPWAPRLLVATPLLAMGVLTKTILIPALADPEAAYYTSTLGYPAQQRAADQPITVEVITVAADTLADALAAPGEVIAQEQVELRPAVEGIVQAVYVEEGDQVSKEQILLRLDPGPFAHAVDIAQLNLATARANLAAVQSSRDASLNHLKTAVATSQSQLARAEANLNHLSELVTSQRAIDLTALEVQLTNAQAKLTSVQTLVSQGALAAVQLQEAENTVAQLQRQFLTAQQGSLPTQRTLQDASTAITQHRQQVQQNQQSLDRALELEAIRLQKAQLTVKNREVLLAEAQRAQNQTIIRANTSGLVSAVHVDAGEVVRPNTPEPSLLLSQDLVFQAYVDQARLHEVHVGDRAVVRLVAHSGQAIPGEVIRVNPTVETEDFIPGRVGVDRQYTYSVWVKVTGLDLSPGLQGYVHFTKTRQGLFIPESAVVHLSGGDGMVMVVNEGKAVLRALELGPLQDNQRQVLSGLTPGEQVILHPNGLEPGDRVHPTSVPEVQPIPPTSGVGS